MRALAVVVIATLPTVLGLLAPTSISNLLNGADPFGDLRLLTDSAWERDGGYRRIAAVSDNGRSCAITLKTRRQTRGG